MRWFVVAYWPFTAYDALWVYGYEGRLYALLGYIPKTIGYYPQFLALQYTYAQLGGINDHMARAVLPFLHIGSILATYVLGSRLINRRTGIIAAAIWALYPSVGEWSRAGDLEIPLAFAFTLAAAFFLLAWTGHEPRRRYALIAGVLLGVGLWIKPTMGAFILGIGLMVRARAAASALRLAAGEATSGSRAADGDRGCAVGRGVVRAQSAAGAAAAGVSARLLANTGAAQRRRIRLAAGGADRLGDLSALALSTLRLAAWRVGAGAGVAGACAHDSAEFAFLHLTRMRPMSLIEFALLAAGIVVLAMTRAADGA